ncbi:slipin family protein [Saccharibacillus sp. CPCC 101409]|uniref:slipin family protein n=1 Tax=Saccharibacillus sp. CPCC 101409 TaxID=3058041 RepID=UPI002672C9B8|nr:slipin family protein [Saccharibacillus sp. CPCC 101409]MDO3409393.1 slipin family protein [Saccharibacillus sp. CPCC 101409]
MKTNSYTSNSAVPHGRKIPGLPGKDTKPADSRNGTLTLGAGLRTVEVRDGERALLFERGRYVRLLMPGEHRFFGWSGGSRTVVFKALNEPFQYRPSRLDNRGRWSGEEEAAADIRLFAHDPELMRQVTVAEVGDDEYAVHMENGRFESLLTAGTYAFWNEEREHSFIRADLSNPEAGEQIPRSAMEKIGSNYIQIVDVSSHETGLLYFDNKLVRRLGPGRSFFWKGPVAVTVEKFDLRRQQLDMTGQEILTEDKVSLRLNFVCQYKIADPLRAAEIKNVEEQVYVQLQLLLREYVGTLKLDDLLRMKEEIGDFVLARLSTRSGDYGVEFLAAGLKDVILPGETRSILNTVLLAEKKAQANMITRREETASTRSLLNTAKLMDENATLYRLKELEFVEKICEKIGTISLSGGGNLLEQMNGILGLRREEERKEIG